MITFGYKNRFNGPIRALTAVAIGVVMVMSKTNALELAVRVIAAFLFASGLVSLIVGYKNRSNGTMGLMGFNAVVDLLLGAILFLFPGIAAGLLIYLIAFVLICFGLFQIISLVSATRVLRVGVLAFVLPVLVLMAGAFLMAKPDFVGETIGIIAGVALIIYGASELLSSWKMKKAIDEYEIHHPKTEQEQTEAPEEQLPDAKEVDYEKIDK